MAKKRVVAVLGHEALGSTLPKQKEALKKAVKTVADLIEKDYQVVITHSNGPQVSMIHTAMTELSRQHGKYTVSPMSVCSAMSQGYIGYDLQNTLRAELLERGIYKNICTVLTQVTVDPYDDAFGMPQKQIGRYMTEEEAKAEEDKNNYVVKVEGRGYRRIVADPRPIRIVEIDAIRTLSDAGQIVIACGGGGIPVIEQRGKLKGASAVIEKDRSSAVLAAELKADTLLILTGVEQVCLNYGTENEIPLAAMTQEEALQYIEQGHFEKSTMLPKIEAALEFCEKCPGSQTIITSLEKGVKAMVGKGGTVIQ
ncbi:MAG: carbamate kinase [Lachnospiraceae bacterium]|nr:carbamate kinase [Lachnospiraceae bacterium]